MLTKPDPPPAPKVPEPVQPAAQPEAEVVVDHYLHTLEDYKAAI